MCDRLRNVLLDYEKMVVSLGSTMNEARLTGTREVSLMKYYSSIFPLFDSDGNFNRNGFAVGTFIMTTKHYILQVYLKFDDTLVELKLMESNEEMDYALFAKPSGILHGSKCIPGIPSLPLAVQQDTASIVYVLGFFPSINFNIDKKFEYSVSAGACSPTIEALAYHNAPTEAGVSGAPVLNTNNQVIGFHQGYDMKEGLNVMRFLTPSLVRKIQGVEPGSTMNRISFEGIMSQIPTFGPLSNLLDEQRMIQYSPSDTSNFLSLIDSKSQPRIEFKFRRKCIIY